MSRRLLLATPLLAVAGLAPGGAEAISFVLSDGEVVEGRVIAATRNTLTVLRDIGGIRQIARTRLERVQVDTPRGAVAGVIRQIDGERILIGTPAGNAVWVEGDRVVAEEPADPPSIQVSEVSPVTPAASSAGREGARTAPAETEAGPSSDRPGPAAGAQPDARPAEPTRPALADAPPRPRERGLAPGRSFGGLVSEAAAAPAGEVPEENASPDGPPLVRIVVSEPEVDEQAGQVGFRIELSHASSAPIRLVYSTVDGQASAGQDYEASQGVFTLPPGETGRSIETAILDDGEAEEAEQFFLFVTTDAEQATIAEKWHTVTIKDDD